MAPRGPGGRRRNAWNPSRDRKLLRLYTLTKLTKQEIQRVLAADGFNPCPRDIQSKLRALLPPEYRRDYRMFRPLDNDNMMLRCANLRRCRNGRILKQRRTPSLALLRNSTSSTDGHADMPSDCSEGYRYAFRNYGTSSDLIATTALTELRDTQLVNPASLMLDGSSVPRDVPLSNHETSPIADCMSNDQSRQSRVQPHELGIGQQQSTSSSSPPRRRLSRLDRLHRLKIQLSNYYSQDHLKHFDSVLVRLSLSNSSKSTLVSLSSRASTLLSNLSSRDLLQAYETITDISDNTPLTELAQTAQGMAAGGNSVPDTQFWSQLFEILEEKDKDETWHEWLHDNMTYSVAKIPSYYNITLRNRRCCMNKSASHGPQDRPAILCEKCGFAPEHQLALDMKGPDLTDISNLDVIDFYGNTPLHCASERAATNGTFRDIRNVIRRGMDLSVCNTFGETFLHILCGKGPPSAASDRADFIEILLVASKSAFPFSQPDYHGRTVLHRLFHHSTNAHSVSFLTRTYNHDFLWKIFSVMKPNLTSQDNSGFRVDHFLEDLCGRISNDTDAELLGALLRAFQGPPSEPVYFERSQDNISLATSWLRLKQQRPWCVKSIDGAGDTPLTSILKHWKRYDQVSLDIRVEQTPCSGLRDIVEEMFTLGVEINMRDRRGNTALSIAAQGGHLAVVAFLLSKGANVHSRDYRGVGILQQLELLRHAHAADGKLWAALLSCHILLSDHEALDRPNNRDEWMLPSWRQLCLRPSTARDNSSPGLPSSASVAPSGSSPASSSSLDRQPTPELNSSADVYFNAHKTHPPPFKNINPAPPLPTTAAQSRPGSPEMFKRFRVSLEASTHEVLPEILREYNIGASPEQYTLYIEYGSKKRCLGMEDKPLAICERKHREGKKPMFVLQPTARSQRLTPPLQPIYLKIECSLD